MSLSIEVAAGTDVGCVRDNNKDNSGYDRRHTLYYRFVREWVDGLPGRSPAGSLSALCWSILTGHAKAAIFREAPKHWRECSEGANVRACAIQIANDPLVLSSARGSRSYSPVQDPTGGRRTRTKLRRTGGS